MAKKKKSSSFEDSVRKFTGKFLRPKTGEGSGPGREQGVGPAEWDNSKGMYKKKKRSM